VTAQKDVNITITLDASGAIAGVKQFTGEVVKGVGKATKEVSGLENAIGAVGGALIFQKLKGAIKGAADQAAFATQNLSVLRDVVNALGKDGEAAVKAARDLSDAMLSEYDAAEGLRNLMASGLELPKAIELMETLKNSAAANRRASMSLAQQIISTTEGIRNNQAALTDNSGITKNASTIQLEYARSVDKTINQLSQQELALATANGFIKEGAVFMGTYEKQLGGYLGMQGRATKATRDLAIAFGEQLQPAMTTMYSLIARGTESLTGLTSTAGDLVPVLAAAAIAFPAVAAGIKAVTFAWNILKASALPALIASIVAGLVVWLTTTESGRRAWATFVNAIQAGVVAAKAYVVNLVRGFTTQFPVILELFELVKRGAGLMWGALKFAAEKIWDGIKWLGDNVKAVFGRIADWVGGIVKRVAKLFGIDTSEGDGLVNDVKDIYGNAGKAAVSAFGTEFDKRMAEFEANQANRKPITIPTAAAPPTTDAGVPAPDKKTLDEKKRLYAEAVKVAEQALFQETELTKRAIDERIDALRKAGIDEVTIRDAGLRTTLNFERGHFQWLEEQYDKTYTLAQLRQLLLTEVTKAQTEKRKQIHEDAAKTIAQTFQSQWDQERQRVYDQVKVWADAGLEYVDVWTSAGTKRVTVAEWVHARLAEIRKAQLKQEKEDAEKLKELWQGLGSAIDNGLQSTFEHIAFASDGLKVKLEDTAKSIYAAWLRELFNPMREQMAKMLAEMTRRSGFLGGLLAGVGGFFAGGPLGALVGLVGGMSNMAYNNMAGTPQSAQFGLGAQAAGAGALPGPLVYANNRFDLRGAAIFSPGDARHGFERIAREYILPALDVENERYEPGK